MVARAMVETNKDSCDGDWESTGLLECDVGRHFRYEGWICLCICLKRSCVFIEEISVNDYPVTLDNIGNSRTDLLYDASPISSQNVWV